MPAFQIGDRGAAALGAWLGETAAPLNTLALIANQIGVAGCVRLAEGLKRNGTVEHLYLGSNPLGRPSPDGIDALKQAAAGRDTLQVHFS